MIELDDTITLTTKGVLYQVSVLGVAVASNVAQHVAEVTIWGDDANTANVYLGGPRMVANSPTTNAPANYSAALSGTTNPYSEGSGNGANNVHLSTLFLISTADAQKIHIKTRVV